MIVAEYACGGWIAQTPLPPTEAAIYKSITTIQNYNDGILTQILQNNNYAKVCPTYSLGVFQLLYYGLFAIPSCPYCLVTSVVPLAVP